MKESIEIDGISNTKSLNDLLKGRDNYFDLIRLIAALLVIFSHAYPLSGTGKAEPLYHITNGQTTFGNLAVIIFFIISGLLITQSFLYSNNLITFLKNRVLRIFPGLLGVLLFSAFILGPMVTSFSVSEYISNYGVLQYLKAIFLFPMQWNLPGVFEENAYKGAVNGSLWTIPFEFLCYLLIGALGFLGLLKHKYLVLLVTAGLFYYYLFNEKISPAGAGHIFGLEIKTLVELLLFFLMGTLACLFKEKIYLDKKLVMIGIFILFISIFYGGFKPLFAIFGTYIILYIAYLPKTKVALITKYGDFSYGIYLYAFPIQQAITHWYGGKTSLLANFLIATPLTILFAIASWFIIEKNFLKLKKLKIVGETFKTESFAKPIKKMYEDFKTLLKYLLNISWMKFSIYFIIFVLLFLNFNSKPNVIEFPYLKGENIFYDGWLPQNKDENYRWIANKASVELDASINSVLIINGFVPESFTEVNKVIIYSDNMMVGESNLIAGEGFFLNFPIKSKSNSTVVTIEFNAAHIPADNDVDQRLLSALISKIEIKN
ncbi:acyltransferase family protein [Paenibacillus sp. NRS-1760]|uniref:acyltransferase family protein n=1 Tax=Paenibacillus sp. NRS-1760 TaxID=3233902 RepID=UPI003D278A2D